MKLLLTIITMVISICVHVNNTETCTDEYCPDIVERHESEKHYTEDEQEVDKNKYETETEIEGGTELDKQNDLLEINIDGEGNGGLDDTRYEFPTLHRIDPGKVGDEVQVELEPGKYYTRITKATEPPIFVIPKFLSDEECDHIIQSAVDNGLVISNLFGAEIENELSDEKIDKSDISRISDQTWLSKTNLGEEFWYRLHKRVSKLTELPEFFMKSSEPIQVVSYEPGGHYHAHFDSTDHAYDRPCCIQTRCGEREQTAQWSECCRLCRFITVLYYLNEPEEGGETAFPIADMSDDLVDEKYQNLRQQEWYNLSRYCHNSSVKVTPTRGTAVMWYTHHVDDETGYLGKIDRRSQHGGCDLIKGTKWIANNWISASTFDDRYKRSLWFNEN